VWNSIASDTALVPANAPLTIDNEYFPSRDAVISLPKFIKFWYVLCRLATLLWRFSLVTDAF
jgi:hypothetical protein